MKTKFLALALLMATAACNQAPTNNAAGNQAAGLPTPPERPANSAAPVPTVQQAAMPAGLDCIRNRLSPEERRETAAVAMEQGARDDPRVQRILELADACGEELSWSPQKRRLAGIFTMSAAGAAGVREFLAGRGISVDELDRAILSDQQLLQAAAAGQLTGTVGQEFAMRHSALIERMAGANMDQEVGTRIGNYIAFRALAETSAGQFGQEP